MFTITDFFRFGLGRILSDVITEEELGQSDNTDSDEHSSSSDESSKRRYKKHKESSGAFTEKASNAVDYSDINELADDLPQAIEVFILLY